VKLTQSPGYVRLWIASTVSDFGTYITTIALSVIVVLRLGGDSTDVGLVSAARWLSYPMLGLLAGTWVDRRERKPILVASDFGRGLILVAIATLGLAHQLTIPILAALIFVFGALSLFSDVAFQSFVPQLVPRELLVRANARIEQSDSVAQTTGPALAGWITQLIAAPAALLVDAASYFVSGVVVASISIERAPAVLSSSTVGFGRSIREGLSWVYRHPRLAPLALTTHLWFLFFSMFGTVFTVYALRERDLGADGLGVVLALAGIGAVLGTLATARIGETLGVGRTIILSRCLYPVAFAIIASAGFAPVGDWWGFAAIGLGQFLIGLALGVEGAQEMAYQQAVTPNRLMGRMRATIRSINRGVVVVGAPLGGLVADRLGNRPTISITAAGMVLVVLLLAVSDVRNARMEDQLSAEEAVAE